MPNNTNYTPIQAAWIDFTDSVRPLLGLHPDDRPLDQYLAFRDTTFTLVQGEKFLKELDDKWGPFTDNEKKEIGNALLVELKAFTLAIEVARATEKTALESKTWLSKWLNRASTVTGSVKDLVENLPDFAKSAITLFKELVDLFKGKD